MLNLAAASGLEAAQTFIQVISHDLANSRTAGYKSNVALFATQMSIDKGGVGSTSSNSGTIIPSGVQVGMGTKTLATARNLGIGTPTETGNPFHLAIQGSGNGYFQVELPSGETAYTRAGVFTLSNTGEIVTQQGFVVSPGITVPPSSKVTISASGEVSALVQGQTAPQVLGQLELASFANPGGLWALENTMFMETQASGSPIVGQPGLEGFGTLLQGWYENSNVNTILAVTDLIEAQRWSEICHKAIEAEDAVLKVIVS